jgi:F0F1-type ATP synthase epsilon subunit
MPSPRLTVQVLSPTSVLYAGSALAVTSFNDQGRFDILALHANFISLVKKAVIIRTEKQRSQKIALDFGVLHCHNNQVKVFVGLAP